MDSGKFPSVRRYLYVKASLHFSNCCWHHSIGLCRTCWRGHLPVHRTKARSRWHQGRCADSSPHGLDTPTPNPSSFHPQSRKSTRLFPRGSHVVFNSNILGAKLFVTGLFDASLFGAPIFGSHLFYAKLHRAHLQRTHLQRPHLLRTHLHPAHIHRSRPIGYRFLLRAL